MKLIDTDALLEKALPICNDPDELVRIVREAEMGTPRFVEMAYLERVAREDEIAYRCGKCGAFFVDPEGYEYCPHCGSWLEMEENENGEN